MSDAMLYGLISAAGTWTGLLAVYLWQRRERSRAVLRVNDYELFRIKTMRRTAGGRLQLEGVVADRLDDRFRAHLTLWISPGAETELRNALERLPP